MNFGEQVKEYRKRKGMTQRELADESGLTQATISRIECGMVRELKSEALKRLAYALGITVDFLIGKSDILEPEDFIKSDSDAERLFNGFQKLSSDGRIELLNYLDYLESQLEKIKTQKKSRRKKR